MSAPVIQQKSPETKPDQPIRANRTLVGRAWHRIRLAIQEMNYASRRVVELQAPWSLDKQWHRR
jgi:hypothetical protein